MIEYKEDNRSKKKCISKLINHIIMKKIKFHFACSIACCFVILFSSWFSRKTYSVEFSGPWINVTVPAPPIGMAGPNEIYFRGVARDDVGKEIYNGLTGVMGFFRRGNYTVVLYVTKENEYGETVKINKGDLCTLNAEKVKRYKDYAHFKEAYPIYYYMEKKCFPRFFNNRN